MIVSRQSKKKVYHHEYCPYAKRIDLKHRKNWSLNAVRSKGYTECSWCGGIHGLYIALIKGIKTWSDPRPIKSMQISWDKIDKAICLRTDIGFWKVLWCEKEKGYKLWHLNANCFKKNLSDKQLMRKNFHRQADVSVTKSIGRIINYIYEHDKAKKIMSNDWHKLPKQTQKQKNYYNRMKKKERKKSLKRVDAIFKQLERERNMKNG